MTNQTLQANIEVDELLRSSGGKPVIQIVLDPASDQTSIRSAGIEGAAVPAFLARLGRLMSGES